MKLLLIVFSFVALSCNSTTETTKTNDAATEEVTPSSYTILNTVDFKAKIESLSGQEFHLVDVRTQGEVAGGTIENATNIDFNSSSFADELGKLDKEKPLLLFCRSGNRSGRASKIAKELGFNEIYDLQGGYLAWSAQ